MRRDPTLPRKGFRTVHIKDKVWTYRVYRYSTVVIYSPLEKERYILRTSQISDALYPVKSFGYDEDNHHEAVVPSEIKKFIETADLSAFRK